MHDIPEEAVKAAINAWFEETRPHVMNTTPLPEQARRMRLAITAALPFLQRMEALDGAAKIADELEERTKLKYMSPDGEECQIVPLTVIIEASKALRALPFLPVQGAVSNAKIEAARKAVEELAYTPMNLPLEDWSRISSAILSALEPSAAQERCRDCDGYNCDDGCAYPEPSAARELALEEHLHAIEQQLAVNLGYFHDEKRFLLETLQAHITTRIAAIRVLSSPDHADAGKVEGEGWLPISSAPKEGGFLAANSTEVWAAWHYDSANWHARYGSRGATHWRPLPTPPSGEVA